MFYIAIPSELKHQFQNRSENRGERTFIMLECNSYYSPFKEHILALGVFQIPVIPVIIVPMSLYRVVSLNGEHSLNR